MKNTVGKLLAASMALILSVAMVVTITYAWTTLSTTPVVEGVQIAISGSSTILIAPDLSEVVDGTTYHYPGHFSDNLNFSRYENYSYLSSLDALSPVSTSNGLHWFLPEYYDISDEAVKNGEARVGDVKPVRDFVLDTELEFANLSGSDASTDGHYLYLDFWVVSPSTNYTLRISRGDESGGSYLLELPTVSSNESGYTLTDSDGSFAAAARIGFLANTDYVTDNTMVYYQKSPAYNDQFRRLSGFYQEKGSLLYSGDYRFLIYEPNGDLHPGTENTGYVATTPVATDGNQVFLADIRDRLSVQLNNIWKKNGSESILLEQIFQTAISGKDVESPQDAASLFYDDYLQGQFAPYVTTGSFVSNISALYGCMEDDGSSVSAEAMHSLNLSGATEDTYIVKLEKNVPQRIRMFVWIEGQDVDCDSSASNRRFALSIELAGSNQD